MNATVSNKITNLSCTAAVSFVVMMMVASVRLNNREVILPEAAAMAFAMWVYREPGWIRRPAFICISPTVAAGIGLTINHLQVDFTVKVVFTLLLIMLFLRMIRSNLAPAIATGLLPLAINTRDWSFVWIVLIFTMLLMLGVLVFKLNRGLAKEERVKHRYKFVFLVLSFCWIGLCWIAGYQHLAVIPPIFVVVYESLQKPTYTGMMVLKQSLTLTLSVSIGVGVFFSLESPVLAATVDMMLILAFSYIFRVRIPAMYAVPLLTFVFPEDQIMTLPFVTLSANLFMLTSVLLYKKAESKRALMSLIQVQSQE